MNDQVTSSIDRRHFLSLVAAATATISMPGTLAAFGQSASLSTDPNRPQFHFLPAANWMNDPNGPIYVNGKYHMFFQYNAHLAITDGMSWGHAISPDMIHWQHQPVAIAPTPGSADADGIWTGSCFTVGARVYAVYTGVAKSSAEQATIHGNPNLHESQHLAYSDDPALLHWTKEPQPIVPAPPLEMQVTGFRDPSVWKQGEFHYMTVGSGVEKVGGCVLLYRSRDLKTWEYQHKLTEGAWSSDPEKNEGDMWECPEFFPLGDGHVLIYSAEGRARWQSGKLDTETMRFRPEKRGILDAGAYYAPKTQLDAHGQRILWGWLQERRSAAAYSAAGWAGVMSLPRRLQLDPDGLLHMEILPELSTLRGAPISSTGSTGKVQLVLPQANGELLCEGTHSGKLELVLTNRADQSELLRIAYDAEKHTFLVESHEILLAPNDAPHIHLFTDGSVIEAILSHREGYTKRIYFNGSKAPDIAVQVQGSFANVSAWPVRAISKDRLTG